MVSGSISLLCSRCFSPFPHGTGSLSVSQEYLALADGAAGFRQDFSGPALLRILTRYGQRFTYGTITLYGPTFQLCSVTMTKSTSSVLQPRVCRNKTGLGFFPFARHYLGNHSCFLLLRLLRCFSSAGSHPRLRGIPGLQPGGLPHSEISGLMLICSYPKLIAACHVLLRL
jgi:hypothetical protein